MAAKSEDLTIENIIAMYYFWQYDADRCDVFYFNLISAIKTADHVNRRRLNISYPNFVYVFNLWSASDDYGNELFREYKIGRFADDSVIDIF